MHAAVGVTLYLDRRHGESLSEFKEALKLNPTDWWTHWHAGMPDQAIGNLDRALASYHRAYDLSGGNVAVLALLAMAYGQTGRTEEAERYYGELMERSFREHLPAAPTALACAGTGRLAEAFDWLNRGLEERSPLLLWTSCRCSTACAPIRASSR